MSFGCRCDRNHAAPPPARPPYSFDDSAWSWHPRLAPSSTNRRSLDLPPRLDFATVLSQSLPPSLTHSLPHSLPRSLAQSLTCLTQHSLWQKRCEASESSTARADFERARSWLRFIELCDNSAKSSVRVKWDFQWPRRIDVSPQVIPWSFYRPLFEQPLMKLSCRGPILDGSGGKPADRCSRAQATTTPTPEGLGRISLRF